MIDTKFKVNLFLVYCWSLPTAKSLNPPKFSTKRNLYLPVSSLNTSIILLRGCSEDNQGHGHVHKNTHVDTHTYKCTHPSPDRQIERECYLALKPLGGMQFNCFQAECYSSSRCSMSVCVLRMCGRDGELGCPPHSLSHIFPLKWPII